jgi:hypothetical protein
MGKLKMNRRETVEKYCRGCTLKDVVLARALNSCIISSYSNNDICPCVNCLVKPACHDKHGCIERLEFIEKMQFRDYMDDQRLKVYELGKQQRIK